VVKWSTTPIIDQGPNFGSCACLELKICSILYLILEKSLLLVKKAFLAKQAYLASWQPKNLTKRLKTVFFGESLVFKGLRAKSLKFSFVFNLP